MQALEQDNARLRQELEALRPPPAEGPAVTGPRLTGYLDAGFFFVLGDGSGIRSDLGNVVFPEYRDQVPGSWVFMGDPLSTTINSRGEPANTAESRAVTFNPVANGGKPSFIVNTLNLGVLASVGESTLVEGLVDFVPRSRNVSNPGGLFLGDFLDVKLAYVEYRVPRESFSLSLFAGKFDSVLGIEYRSQEAPDRLGVTPSLLCRYTCGRPLGVKARGRFFDNALVVNVAVTNGSYFTEMFPFFNEIAVNNLKTIAGRISYRIPVGAGLELGASGAVGAQDNQPGDDVIQWHYGFDLSLAWRDLELSGEFIQGSAPGKTGNLEPPCGVAPCLNYLAAYGQIGYRWTNLLTTYVRVDGRDALHRSGASFVYVSKLVRGTVGLRLQLGTEAVAKLEYTHIQELPPLPEFPDDVLTSSLVLKY